MKLLQRKYTVSKFEERNALPGSIDHKKKLLRRQFLEMVDKEIHEEVEEIEYNEVTTLSLMIFEPGEFEKIVKMAWELGDAYGDTQSLLAAKTEQANLINGLKDGSIKLDGVAIDKPKTCPTCKGSGEVQVTDIDHDECRRCKGTGKI